MSDTILLQRNMSAQQCTYFQQASIVYWFVSARLNLVTTQDCRFVCNIHYGVNPTKHPVHKHSQERGSIYPQVEWIFAECIQDFIPLGLPEVTGCSPEFLQMPVTSQTDNCQNTGNFISGYIVSYQVREFLAAAKPISAELTTNKTLRSEDKSVGLFVAEACPDVSTGAG